MRKSKARKSGKVIIGTVVGDKMDKTIVVRVGRLTVHPVFKKRIRVFNKFKAHDEKNQAKVGATVRITQSRPLSKGKQWRLVEVIEKAA